MFGGGTNYVETLDAILEFVQTHQPTTDELVGWHRGTFVNVSSRSSIMRRVSYLQEVGFIQQTDTRWRLGEVGRRYIQNQETTTLLQIMCNRNVGLRSLLYALSAAPMTVSEISDQQLDTHPELGWSRGQTDMATQRINWLRSMGLIEKPDGECILTDEGWTFVESAVEEWAQTDTPTASSTETTAGTYETTVHARSVDPEFRATVLSQHDQRCPISGVDHPGLLDVAHVLSWSEYPQYRADISNVLPLSKTHHAAFARELFTIDDEYRIQVNPAFETQSELLQETILNRAGEQVALPGGCIAVEYINQHNAALDWA
jgi:putative restriction endonuclease